MTETEGFQGGEGDVACEVVHPDMVHKVDKVV